MGLFGSLRLFPPEPEEFLGALKSPLSFILCGLNGLLAPIMMLNCVQESAQMARSKMTPHVANTAEKIVTAAVVIIGNGILSGVRRTMNLTLWPRDWMGSA